MRAFAARSKSTQPPRNRGDAKFVVLAQRQDGRPRIFQAYPTEHEAEAVAAKLRSLGCAAIVETTEAMPCPADS
jgi:hypothetical protein